MMSVTHFQVVQKNVERKIEYLSKYIMYDNTKQLLNLGYGCIGAHCIILSTLLYV